MKTKILSYFASVTVVGTIAGILCNAFILGLFATAVSAAVLLIVATDYAPRRCLRPVLCTAPTRARETLPFAA